MGVGFPRVGVFLDQKRNHALRQREGWNVTGSGGESLGPQFQTQAVLNDQSRTDSSLNVAWCGLVTMNFRAWLHDGSHPEAITGDVASQIREHGERGEHAGPLVRGRRKLRITAASTQEKRANQQSHGEAGCA